MDFEVFSSNNKNKNQMKFKVFSRDEIKGYSLKEDHVVISICAPEDTPAELAKIDSRLDTLHLFFHDFDRKIKGYKLFSIKDVRKIIDFVEKYKNKVKCIVVQCDAGISRSPAIAAALSKAMACGDNHFFTHYIPNRYVYSLLYLELMKSRIYLDLLK